MTEKIKEKNIDNTINNITDNVIEEISIIIDGIEIKGKKKLFKSGRCGWGAYGMIKIKNFPHRVSINLIEVGS